MNEAEGTTILLVTHSRELAARAKRTLVMKSGRIIEKE
jgi:predicted ABC-type transport system involved in lysophospholipase L1 biosynthesis ATPase subunit